MFKQFLPQEKFSYKYLAGPVLTLGEIEAGVKEGNCRYALQLYFYRMHNKFLERDQIYLPGGYKVLGEFIFKEESIDYVKLKAGDVLYAQGVRNKDGKGIDKSLKRYKDKDEWLYHPDTLYVWHATNIEGGPVLWTLDKFLHYYKVISAKRVV